MSPCFGSLLLKGKITKTMDAKIDKYSDLIYKYVNSNLSLNEEYELKIWLEKPSNKKLFDSIIDEESIYNKTLQYDVYLKDRKTSWEKLNKKINSPKKVIKWYYYAASILLPLIVIFLLINPNKLEIEQPVSELIKKEPGSGIPKLLLADGSIIKLDAKKQNTIQFNNNKIDNNKEVVRFIKTTSVSKKIAQQKVIIPRGAERKIILPDGTKVWLNSESYIEFPEVFSSNKREVKASGELYFDVVSNAKKPFFVKLKNATIKVLGTEFNVRSYEDESCVKSTLIEGKVEITSNINKNKSILKPGELAKITKNNSKIKISKASIEEVTAWKRGMICFQNRSLEYILNDLSRWYNIEVFFLNKFVRNEKFSIELRRYQKFIKVLKLLEKTEKVKFVIKNNVVCAQ